MDAAGWKTRPPLHGGRRLRATGLQHGRGGWGASPGSAAVPGRSRVRKGHGGCARGRARSQERGAWMDAAGWKTRPPLHGASLHFAICLEPWFIAPFQGLDRWWAGQPGALPRAGVARAVGAPGSWQASQAWGRRVGRLVDFDGPPLGGNPDKALRRRFF